MADLRIGWHWSWGWLVIVLVMAVPSSAAASEEPPVCFGNGTSTAWDTPAPIELECEGEGPFTFEIVEGPEVGEITEFDPEEGSLVYVPSPKYVGSDGFLFTAINESGPAEPAWFEIQVTRPYAPAGTPEHQLNLGGYGFGGGFFRHPADVAVGAEGHVFVVDPNLHKVQEFTHDGAFVEQFGSHGDDPGELIGPSAIAIDDDGNLWIADTGNSRIQRLGPDGEFISQFGSYGNHISSLEGTDELNYPTGIAVGPDGRIYVSDTLNRRVLKFSKGGFFLAGVVLTGAFGPAPDVSGFFVEPTPTGIDVGPEGNVWVADRMTVGLLEFNEELEYLRATSSPAMKRPDAVAVDAQGDVWAGDERNFRVVRFDREGSFLSAFGTWSGLPGGTFDFRHSFGIDVDDHNHVWISDPANYRVQRWVEHSGQAPLCGPASATTAVDVPLSLAPGDLGCEGDTPLEFELTTPPEHGEITEFDSESGALKYTPDPEYHGPDSFGFEVSNEWGPWVESSFDVEVGVAPKCEDLELSTATDEELGVELECTGDYAEAAYEIVKGPAHGEISGLNAGTGSLTYTPEFGYQGGDKFTYRRASWVHSDLATVTIGVCGEPSLEVGGAVTDTEAPGLDLWLHAEPESWLCGGIESLRVWIDEDLVYSEDRHCDRDPEGCRGRGLVRNVQLPYAKVLGTHEFKAAATDEFGLAAKSATFSGSTEELGTVLDLSKETVKEGKCSRDPKRRDNVLIGTPCNDTLRPRPSVTIYRGLNGDDKIYGGGRTEKLFGDDGADSIFAGRGSDFVRAGQGSDLVVAGSGDDEIRGEDDADTLDGGPGADRIKGGAGGDLIRGGATTDKLWGEGGTNTLSYADGVTPGFFLEPDSTPLTGLVEGFPAKHDDRGVYVNLDVANGFADNGEVARFGGGTDKLRDDKFQNVIGTPFADLIVGSDEDNVIDAGGGTDIVRTGDGADQIYGGGEQDYLDGGAGVDTIDGGLSTNDVCLDGTGSACENSKPEEILSQPSASILTVGVVNAHSPLEESSVYVRGSSGADSVTATEEPGKVVVTTTSGTFDAETDCTLSVDKKEATCVGSAISSIVMNGGAEKDTLEVVGFTKTAAIRLLGGDGDDTLVGGNGSEDVLVDGRDEGKDKLKGKGGDDTLFSNQGKDVLKGEEGEDLFVSAEICDKDEIFGGGGNDNANWAQLVGPEIEEAGYPEKLGDEIYKAPKGGVKVKLTDSRIARTGEPCGEKNEGRIGGVENLEGSRGPDVLVGNGQKNILLGRSGRDTLRGRGGDDSILANNRNPTNKATPAQAKDIDMRLECGSGNHDTLKLDPADKAHFELSKFKGCETKPKNMIQPPANWRPLEYLEEPEDLPGDALDEERIGALSNAEVRAPVAFFRLDEDSGTGAVDWTDPETPEEGEEEELEDETEEEQEEIAAEEEVEEEDELEPEEEPTDEPTLGAYEGGVGLGQGGAMDGSRAVELDGVDDYLDLTTNWDPQEYILYDCGERLAGYSVEMWVKFDGEATAREELFSRSLDGEGVFLYRGADGRINFSVAEGIEAPTVTTEAPIDDGEWHHVVAMMAQRAESCASRGAVGAEELEALSSPELVLYVDGFPQALIVGTEHQRVIPETLADARNLVGARAIGGGFGNWLAGTVDDVAIYGHPLSFDEVSEHLAASDVAQPSVYLDQSVDVSDLDEDGAYDSEDNCAEVANPEQEDEDNNGVGDACEPDPDGDEDGVVDELDNCELPNPLQEDLNENLIGDVCEAVEEEE